ncbi:MAG: acyl carrier protein [Acetobacteraceae bacterium]|nr:MAG: acyl carrier protein [Acetobacteraceae bacterium]
MVAILAQQMLLSPDEVALDARIEDLGLDSLGKVEAIFALEERFGIHVPFNANAPDQPEFDFSTVATVVGDVQALLAKGA